MTNIEKSSDRDTIKKPMQFLFSWRPFPIYELLGYILMFACIPLLIFNRQAYNWDIIKIILLSIATLYSGFFAALIWNDITDADIDVVVHPSRPIPRGNISSKKFFTIALVFSVLTFLFALLTSPWCFILVGFNALFVALHDKYLKKRVKIPAYSEIFTPIQWLVVPLFGFFAYWTVFRTGDINVDVPILGYLSIQSKQLLAVLLLVLFTYFADDAHDLAEGIHDVDGDRKIGVRTYATSFGEGIASIISFSMVFLSGLLGILCYIFIKELSLVFLIPFVFLWLYTLYNSYILVKSKGEQRKQLAGIVGRKGFNYLLFTYVFIFLDVVVQFVAYHYFQWVLP